MVLIQLPNCLAFTTVTLGTFASGLTASLVSPVLTSRELAWVLQNCRPGAIVTAKGCLGAMQEALSSQDDQAYFKSVPLFTVDVAKDLFPTQLKGSDERDWKKLLNPPSTALKQPSQFSAPSRAAVILWSSGTSGRSKGVLLSHHALNFAVGSLWHDADYYKGQQQRWIGFVPFYHVYGLLNLFLLAIPSGSTVYMMPSFNLDQMLGAISKRKITYLHMAPPVAVMLAKSPVLEPYVRRDARGQNAFSSVVAGVTGGAPLGHDVVAQVYSRLGFRVRLGYGLTEACSVTLQSGMDEASMTANRDDTGKPHWGVEIKVVKPSETNDNVQAAKLGEPGEVLIRSPGLMMGYLPLGGTTGAKNLDMSPTTEALTPDGWFRTGDIGSIDASGNLKLSDRIKELIKVRAFQVPPAELEAILNSSDEVGDSGVVATYDASEATEWPRAFVVPSKTGLDETELKALAHRLRKLVEKQTAKYKWLKGGITFVDKIPKSPSGKILRRIMKDGGVKGFDVQIYDKKRRDSKL